jgi:hypothetical protein
MQRLLFFKFRHRHQSHLVQYKTEDEERIGKRNERDSLVRKLKKELQVLLFIGKSWIIINITMSPGEIYLENLKWFELV